MCIFYCKISALVIGSLQATYLLTYLLTSTACWNLISIVSKTQPGSAITFHTHASTELLSFVGCWNGIKLDQLVSERGLIVIKVARKPLEM